MDFFELIYKRKSIRKYLDKPVEEEKLNKVLDAARIAPSAVNFQPWTFYVIRDKYMKEKFKEVYAKEWFYTAPVIICGFYDRNVSYKRRHDGREFGEVDVTIALDHLILAAHALGLGTCWIGAYQEEKLKELLGVPDNMVPVCLTPLGYPAEEGRDKNRKESSEIIKYI